MTASTPGPPRGSRRAARGSTLGHESPDLRVVEERGVSRHARSGQTDRTLTFGADLPMASLQEAIGRHRPKLVWISITTTTVSRRFRQEYPAMFQQAAALNAAVMIGGRGLTRTIQNPIVASAFGTRLAHLRAFARELP